MTSQRTTRVLMLGLDGMTYSVLRPAFDAGHMPALRALLERGVSGVLTSTIPPYTPPGWTSIFTGVNPGKHGIFGFTFGHVQSPGGLVRLDRVAAPAVWNVANAQGVRIGLFNVPMTYPPPPVDGFAVAGMLTPEGGGSTPDNFTHPPELANKLVRACGGYEIDIEVDYENDWKSTDIIDRLSGNLARKRKALSLLLDEYLDLDVLFAVLEAPDRVMHVHYKYIDPACEHYEHPEAQRVRARVWEFFDEMDTVIAELVAWAGEQGFVVTMSDHGFGPKNKVVNMNLALREWGLLAITGAGAIAGSAGLRRAARKVKNVMPRSIRRMAKAASQTSIDWSRTKAFSAPIPQQGIYVNLQGREPRGIVPESEYESVRDEIIERMGQLIDPHDGRPVVDRVYKREEVVHGPLAHGAPDLFPVCRAYSYELSDGLYSPVIVDDHSALPRGFHHLDGIFGISGPGINVRSQAAARLYDIAPTVLYLAGLKIPETDGRVLTEYLDHSALARRPPVVEAMSLPAAGSGAEAAPYSAEEEAAIEDSLRNLGYL